MTDSEKFEAKYEDCDEILLVTGERATIVDVIDATHYCVTVTADDGWSSFRRICIDDIKCKIGMVE